MANARHQVTGRWLRSKPKRGRRLMTSTRSLWLTGHQTKAHQGCVLSTLRIITVLTSETPTATRYVAYVTALTDLRLLVADSAGSESRKVTWADAYDGNEHMLFTALQAQL